MPFRFKLAEPFEDGCRRICREQIERALAQLKGAGDPAVAVHETRKALKRLRALLQLIRPALGEESYRAENAHLRETARLLSSARDRHVLLETIAKLSSSSELVRKTVAGAVRQKLQSMNGGEGHTVEAAAMKQAQAMLADTARRFARLHLSGNGFDVVGAGLETTYRKGRRAFHAAYIEGADEAFHEWRKDTQRHWRHMMLLSRAWSECAAARIAAARQLSQVLGDDHDLAMLVAFVGSERASGLGGDVKAAVEKAAYQRQRELRALAQPMGQRLFAEGAKSLHRRFSAYWAAAVELKRHEPEAPEPEKLTRTTPRRRRSARPNPLG